MPSFFTRLRAQSITPTPPVVVNVPTEPEPPTQPTVAPYPQRINRKIHPDPNALLATFTEQLQNEQDRGLRPSSRRPSVDAAHLQSSIAHTPTPEPALDEVSEPPHSREPSQTRTTEASGLLHRFSQLASPSTWSTFGRGKHYPSPRLDQFDKTDSQPGTPRNPSRATTHHGDQPLSRKSSVKPRSSFSHESPSSESKHSTTNQSTTRSRPESARTHITTLHEMPIEYSPRTFGHPTPEAQSSPVLGGGSPLPPLPPLVHQALRTIQASQEEENETQNDIPTTIKRDTGALYHSSREQGTYPRRSRIRKDLSAFSSLPFVTSTSRSKTSPAPTTLPRAQQIFADPFTDIITTPHVDNDTIPEHGRRSNGEQAVESWQSTDILPGTGDGRPVAMLPSIESRDTEPNARTSLPASFSSLSSPSPSQSLSPSLGPPFLLEDTTADLSDPTSQGSRLSLRWPSIRKNRRATAYGSLHATMTGQKKNASDRGSTPPSRPSTAPKSTGDAVGPSSLHKTPFQSFSAASSPRPGSASASDSPSANRFHRRSVSDPQRKSGKRRSEVTTPVKGASTEGGEALGKGKRKADDVEGTPPDHKRDGQHPTFALPADPRPSRTSANSASSTYAPSSYQRKRAKLSTTMPIAPPADSGSGSSHHEGGSRGHHRGGSRTTLPEKDGPSSPRSPGFHSRPSLSQVSIPISALVSPHAPSVSRSGTFHMRDPRKPPRVMETGWALRLSNVGEPGSGSPMHAWLFFVGWVLFPLWWLGSFLRIPRTRRVGDVEKSVTLDDPQVEFDARSWRTRCRIMSAVSFLTYIPFIVLVAVLVRKSH